MSGPKRNPDKLNTIGVVVVGICGAVLVYVTIVALEAFYVNDTSEIQMMADYGGQDTGARSLRTEQVNRIGEYGTNPAPVAPKANEAARAQSYRVPIDVAMKLVVEGAKTHPESLIPAVGASDKSTVLPIFGRPKPLATAPAAPAAAPAAPDAAAGSGAARELPAAPMVPTGAGTGPSPVGGAGALDRSPTPGTPGNPAGTPPSRAGSAAAQPPGTGSAAGAAPKAGSAAGAAPKAGSAAGTPPKGNAR